MSKTPSEPPNLQTPGGRLRWAREAMHLSSPRAAAQKFGWNENTYKSHEQGMRGSAGLKVATARKYARAFGVSVEWLTTGTGAPYPKVASSKADQEWAQMTLEERELALRLLRAARGA